MNTTPITEKKDESNAIFLTPKEQEDFKIWLEQKIRNGSKPYTIEEGKQV